MLFCGILGLYSVVFLHLKSTTVKMYIFSDVFFCIFTFSCIGSAFASVSPPASNHPGSSLSSPRRLGLLSLYHSISISVFLVSFCPLPYIIYSFIEIYRIAQRIYFNIMTKNYLPTTKGELIGVFKVVSGIVIP